MECEEGEVRLVGGVTNSSGRLEVCANGIRGRVCNALRYWGLDNARVVCRQLGFSGEGKNPCNAYSRALPHMKFIHFLCVLDAFVISASVFGAGSRPFLVGEVHCTGTDPKLLECSHNSIGHHRCADSTDDANDVAVVCGMLL